jgi:hypothetical protein
LRAPIDRSRQTASSRRRANLVKRYFCFWPFFCSETEDEVDREL